VPVLATAGGLGDLLLPQSGGLSVVAVLLLDDPNVEPSLAARLALTQEVLAFARDDIALPIDGRYRSYVELRREHVVWNVFATEEFSVTPLVWCYPVIGCAAYRGYFRESTAARAAARLRSATRDVRVDGVAAYSTLGWFDDPLLSTFIDWPDEALAGLLLHELAHGRVYARGDTEFNESYASFVEEEALEQWLRSRVDSGVLAAWQGRRAAAERFAHFMLTWRRVLEELYAKPVPTFARRMLKAEVLRQVKECYQAHRGELGAGSRDREFDGDFNNADFMPWMAYREWVQAFRTLYHSVDSDWQRFHAAVADLAAVDGTSRREALVALRERAMAEFPLAVTNEPMQCRVLEVYPPSGR